MSHSENNNNQPSRWSRFKNSFSDWFWPFYSLFVFTFVSMAFWFMGYNHGKEDFNRVIATGNCTEINDSYTIMFAMKEDEVIIDWASGSRVAMNEDGSFTVKDMLYIDHICMRGE